MFTSTSTSAEKSIAALYRAPLTDEVKQNQKKCTSNLLNGIQDQLLDLNKLTKTQENSSKWQQFIQTASDAIANAQKVNGHNKKFKIDCLNELNTFSDVCDSYIVKLNSLETKLNTVSTKKDQDELKRSFDLSSGTLKDNKKQIFSVYKESIIELNRLKQKIEIYKSLSIPDQAALDSFNYRMRKSVSDCVISKVLNASTVKDGMRIKRFNNLEKAMQNYNLKLEEATHMEERVELAFAACPGIINEKKEAVSKLSGASPSPLSILNELDMQIFSSGFSIDQPKRNLTYFRETLEKLKKEAVKIKSFEESVNDLNSNSVPFHIEMKEWVQKISMRILELENSKDEADLKKTAIAKLLELQTNVVNNYNLFRMDLHRLIFDMQIFNRLVNIKANLANIYLDTETVRSEMRDIRRFNNLRTEHQKIYDSALKIFNEIHKDIHWVERNRFYCTHLDYTMSTAPSKPFFNDKPVLSGKSSIASLHGQMMQLDMEKEIDTLDLSVLLTISQYADKINLILTRKNEAHTFSLLTKQFNEMKTYLMDQRKKIADAYTITLKTMCTYATEEVNLMGNALSLLSNAYDENFTAAYTVKNSVGKKFQHGLALVKDTFWNATPTYDTYKDIDNPIEAFYQLNKINDLSDET